MIMDSRNEFADAVSVAAAVGTALIGNVIDLGATHRDIGNGKTVYLILTVDTEIITAGSAGTVKFQLASDSTADLATSPTIHYDSGTFATGAAASNALLLAGKTLACIALPLEGKVYERYLGILAVTATTTTTAGKINAFLTLDPTGWAAYAQGAL